LNYSKPIYLFIWLSSEFAIIASDIQEILGATIGLSLLFGLNQYLNVFIILFLSLCILFLQEWSQKIMEAVFAVLVFGLGLCFFINFCLDNKQWGALFYGFVPNLPESLGFTAVIGSIIMPQNLFLHSSLVQTRKTKSNPDYYLRVFKIETAIILFVSFFINMCIVCVFANPDIKDETITLDNAGTFLKQFLPTLSGLLWALGLLASGISSTASGALTGQYLMDGIFNKAFSRIKRIIITRIIVVIPCVLIIFFVDVNSIMSILNIIQFIQLPFVVIPLFKFTTNKEIVQGNVLKGVKLYVLMFFAAVLQAINIYSILGVVQPFFLEVGWYFVLAGIVIHTTFLIYLVFCKIKGVREDKTNESGVSETLVKTEIYAI